MSNTGRAEVLTPAPLQPPLWLLHVCIPMHDTDPLFAPSSLAARKALPPTHQQQVLSLCSNVGTESIPRQMFL